MHMSQVSFVVSHNLRITMPDLFGLSRFMQTHLASERTSQTY